MARIKKYGIVAAVYLAATAAMAPLPAVAANSDQPVSERDPNVVDVVTTPLSDVNLRKTKIPPILINAVESPYSLTKMTNCKAISREIGQLDEVLGTDVDLPTLDGPPVSVGKVAQSVVGSVVPFRNIVREISGANKQKRELEYAVTVGIARRSFLKGVGQTRGCSYPARSATARIIQQHQANLDKKNGKAKK